MLSVTNIGKNLHEQRANGLSIAPPCCLRTVSCS